MQLSTVSWFCNEKSRYPVLSLSCCLSPERRDTRLLVLSLLSACWLSWVLQLAHSESGRSWGSLQLQRLVVSCEIQELEPLPYLTQWLHDYSLQMVVSGFQTTSLRVNLYASLVFKKTQHTWLIHPIINFYNDKVVQAHLKFLPKAVSDFYFSHPNHLFLPCISAIARLCLHELDLNSFTPTPTPTGSLQHILDYHH